jgi:hypothetical protein
MVYRLLWVACGLVVWFVPSFGGCLVGFDFGFGGFGFDFYCPNSGQLNFPGKKIGKNVTL